MVHFYLGAKAPCFTDQDNEINFITELLSNSLAPDNLQDILRLILNSLVSRVVFSCYQR